MEMLESYTYSTESHGQAADSLLLLETHTGREEEMVIRRYSEEEFLTYDDKF